jgi:histidyl-tRNA synthetase
VLEHKDVFEKPLGPLSDVVHKEMYTFQPPGSEERITLRPEGTAGTARALASDL